MIIKQGQNFEHNFEKKSSAARNIICFFSSTKGPICMYDCITVGAYKSPWAPGAYHLHKPPGWKYYA